MMGHLGRLPFYLLAGVVYHKAVSFIPRHLKTLQLGSQC
nr:MAG TPA: hypothetical protein [Caudoviricetes sp.]